MTLKEDLFAEMVVVQGCQPLDWWVLWVSSWSVMNGLEGWVSSATGCVPQSDVWPWSHLPTCGAAWSLRRYGYRFKDLQQTTNEKPLGQTINLVWEPFEGFLVSCHGGCLFETREWLRWILILDGSKTEQHGLDELAPCERSTKLV